MKEHGAVEGRLLLCARAFLLDKVDKLKPVTRHEPEVLEQRVELVAAAEAEQLGHLQETHLFQRPQVLLQPGRSDGSAERRIGCLRRGRGRGRAGGALRPGARDAAFVVVRCTRIRCGRQD